MPAASLPFAHSLPFSALPLTHALPAATLALTFPLIPLIPRMIGPASFSPVLMTKSSALVTGFCRVSTIARIFWPIPPRPTRLARKPMMIGTICPSTSLILLTTPETLPFTMSATESMTVLTNFRIRLPLSTKNITMS